MTEQASNPSATLALYADGPAQLEAVLMGLTESDLNLAQTRDSWTIRQIVHHLADGDDLWKTCIKAALGNSEGLFAIAQMPNQNAGIQQIRRHGQPSSSRSQGHFIFAQKSENEMTLLFVPDPLTPAP